MSKEENEKEGYVNPPSFLEMVRNFKDDATEFIKRGAPIMDSAGYCNRLGECNDCEHLIRKSMRCGSGEMGKWYVQTRYYKRWPKIKKK
jgi:hypothetical protein